MKKHITSYPGKLSYEEVISLCQMIGTLHTDREIKNWAKSDLKKFISKAQVQSYRSSKEFDPIITKFRKEYNETFPNIPLVNKLKRITELSNAYERTIMLEEKAHKDSVKLKCIETGVTILGKIQHEVEPTNIENQSTNYYITQFNKFETMSREEFDLYRLNLVDKIKRYKETKGVLHASEIGETTKNDGNRGTQSIKALLAEPISPVNESSAA